MTFKVNICKVKQLAVVVVILLLLAACSGASGGVPASPPPDIQTPTVEVGGLGVEPTATPTGPAPTIPSPSPTPGRAKAMDPETTPPDRNLPDVVRRLRYHSQEITSPLSPTPSNYAAGQRQRFNVTNLSTNVPFTVDATLALVSPHAYWYVAEDVSIDRQALDRAVREYEDRIYPAIRQYVNPKWMPGLGSEPRITILHARVPGVGGYYNSNDSNPVAINPNSNQRAMVYISTPGAMPGTQEYFTILAHELQHAAHGQADPSEETWVQEGLSELMPDLLGFPVRSGRIFLRDTDIQLTAWPDELTATVPHYGAAYLFMKYLGSHYGGYSRLGDLVAEPQDGIAGVQAFLRREGFDKSFDDVFADWVVANYLDAPGDGPYSYRDHDIHAGAHQTVVAPGEYAGTVHQYGARYVEVRPPPGSYRLSFQGPTTASILPATPPSGRQVWWSNHGDSIDSTLTREFDLSGVSKATLTFKLWHEIEKGYDYAYVEASGDGGKTWQILRGRHASDENPVGESFGPGYTGKSGEPEPMWLDEAIDLTPYAGQRVLVRFEYVTDDGTNTTGLAVDDISIRELGFLDDAETDAGWDARGFVRIDNQVPQRFTVRAIVYSAQTRIVDVPLDGANHGEISLGTFGKDVDRVVLVVAGRAAVTTQPTHYRFQLSALASQPPSPSS